MPLPKDILSAKEYEDGLIEALPGSDFGRVFLSRIQEWLDEAEEDYFLTLRICDDDIKQDLRFKAGVMAALRRVINEPKRVREETVNHTYRRG